MSYSNALKKIKNVRYYMEHYLKIRTKSGKIIQLKLKPAQEELYNIIKQQTEEGKPVRIVILKARQLGFSTVIEGMYFQDAATRSNVRTLIVAHDQESTTNLFKMNKLFFDELPTWLQPMQKASNAKEILFENPTRDLEEKVRNPGFRSSIRCVPAAGSGVGRSSTLTNVHASEVAFWRDMDETFTALLQAVPDDKNTSVIIESTPNGFNAFKDFWDGAVSGKNGFLPLFFPWFMEPGYRKEVDPGTVWTEEEKTLKETYNLDDKQLAWRRWCIKTNFTGQEEKFKQEYPSCPEEAFLMSGNPFFNNEIVIMRINAEEPEFVRGRYVYEEDAAGKPINWSFTEDINGEIVMWQRPEERVPYVIGGDTAGDGSDRFTGHNLDNTTGNQVAQLLYDGGSELYYTQQLYCLGMDYNKALIGVEINFSTYPEKKLEEWQYPRLFIREKVDDSRGQLDTYKLGWKTDSRTRPLILANLQTVISQTPDMITSKDLLREMLTFIRNKDMRPEAAPEAHDDLVMAAAIAHQIRYQQSYTMVEIPEEQQTKLIDKLDPRHRYRR